MTVPIVRHLGRIEYGRAEPMMRAFNAARTARTTDEIWLLEHPPVYTLGRAASLEHVHHPGTIEVVRTERGGQVTYHGPGQAICYLLIDLRRRQFGARAFVECIEAATADFLIGYGIDAVLRAGAPGVYVRDAAARAAREAEPEPEPEPAKIASIGIRISSGCTWHGVALNVAMDLEPFSRIDPCGFPGLRMTDMKTCLGLPFDAKAVPTGLESVPAAFAQHLLRRLAPGPL